MVSLLSMLWSWSWFTPSASFLLLRFIRYYLASSDDMKDMSQWSNVPNFLMVMYNWSYISKENFSVYLFLLGERGKQLSPGNSAWVLCPSAWQSGYIMDNSSNKMQPKLHMSAAVSYLFSTKEISGARYHLEATWLDIDLFLFYDDSFSDLSFL